MTALYIVSVEPAAGKTTLAAGIARALTGGGKRVGYLRPVLDKEKAESAGDSARFMKQVLGLPQAAETLSLYLGGADRPADRLREAYSAAAEGRDVVILEGDCGPGPDDKVSKATREMAAAVRARVLAVENFDCGKGAPRFPESYRGFGQDLLGTVINRVPQRLLGRARADTAPGVPFLGAIPEDRTLGALSVAELAERIEGRIVNGAGNTAALVENVMAGAMCVDSGLDYFGRKASKAAVIRGDRPDMQMAALETSTRCLVTTGGAEPIDYVSLKAGEKDIPVILTGKGTEAVVRDIEEALSKSRFGQEKKLTRLEEMLRQNLDLPAIYRALGLSG